MRCLWENLKDRWRSWRRRRQFFSEQHRNVYKAPVVRRQEESKWKPKVR